jgi:arylsulfatase A-like enzyme
MNKTRSKNTENPAALPFFVFLFVFALTELLIFSSSIFDAAKNNAFHAETVYWAASLLAQGAKSGALAGLLLGAFFGITAGALKLLLRRNRLILLSIGFFAGTLPVGIWISRLALERVPVENLPAFASDPQSAFLFFKRILAGMLFPDRIIGSLHESAIPLLGLLGICIALTALIGLAIHIVVALAKQKPWLAAPLPLPGKKTVFALLVLVALVLVVPNLAAGLLRPQIPQKPNVVLISIDTLRADAIGVDGKYATTALNSLAAKGLKFTDATAPSSWTLPSHAGLLTGRHPDNLGVVSVRDRLPKQAKTLAEAMKQAGYDTGSVVTHLFVDRPYGLGQGFDRVQHPGTQRGEDAVNQALSWVSKRRRPFFLFLHLYDPHWPYDAPGQKPEALPDVPSLQTSELLDCRDFLQFVNKMKDGSAQTLQAAIALYRAEVLYVDRHLGRLFDSLPPNTFIVVTSDHGEAFGEHGQFGHGQDLRAEVIRVPLILAGPNIAPSVRTDPVSILDIAPTLASLAGVPWDIPGQSVCNGGNLLDTHNADRMLSYSTSFLGQNARALRKAGWIYHSPVNIIKKRFLITQPAALYNLTADPTEKNNLLDDRPDRAALMQNLLSPCFAESWSFN